MSRAQQLEPVYVVEAIVDSKFDASWGECLFLTKWVGYPSSENTWEPASSFKGGVLLTEYLARVAPSAQGVTKRRGSSAGLTAKSGDKRSKSVASLPRRVAHIVSLSDDDEDDDEDDDDSVNLGSDTTCCVCFQSSGADHTDPLFVCRSCSLVTHLSCYGLDATTSRHAWQCRSCAMPGASRKCVACPSFSKRATPGLVPTTDGTQRAQTTQLHSVGTYAFEWRPMFFPVSFAVVG
jgi:hypothetical protein